MRLKHILCACVALMLGATTAAAYPVVTLTDPNGVPVGTNASPLVVSSGGGGGSAASPTTDASGTVTTGNTYQTVFAASTSRKGCLIQNPVTASGVLNVRLSGVSVFQLPAGATFSCTSPGGGVISDLVAVTSATTGHAFTAVSQ